MPGPEKIKMDKILSGSLRSGGINGRLGQWFKSNEFCDEDIYHVLCPSYSELLFPKQAEFYCFIFMFSSWNFLSSFFSAWQIPAQFLGVQSILDEAFLPSLVFASFFFQAPSAWTPCCHHLAHLRAGLSFSFFFLCCPHVPSTCRCSISVHWINESLVWLNISFKAQVSWLEEIFSWEHTEVSGYLDETLESKMDQKTIFFLLPSLPLVIILFF